MFCCVIRRKFFFGEYCKKSTPTSTREDQDLSPLADGAPQMGQTPGEWTPEVWKASFPAVPRAHLQPSKLPFRPRSEGRHSDLDCGEMNPCLPRLGLLSLVCLSVLSWFTALSQPCSASALLVQAQAPTPKLGPASLSWAQCQQCGHRVPQRGPAGDGHRRSSAGGPGAVGARNAEWTMHTHLDLARVLGAARKACCWAPPSSWGRGAWLAAQWAAFLSQPLLPLPGQSAPVERVSPPPGVAQTSLIPLPRTLGTSLLWHRAHASAPAQGQDGAASVPPSKLPWQPRWLRAEWPPVRGPAPYSHCFC